MTNPSGGPRAGGASAPAPRWLRFLADGPAVPDARGTSLRSVGDGALKRIRIAPGDLAAARRDGFVALLATGEAALTAAGRARLEPTPGAGVVAADPAADRAADPARLTARAIEGPDRSETVVLVDDAESPLAWLRSRRDREGRPLIDDDAYRAGERLRADFTRGGLMPSVTSNWRTGLPQGGGGACRADLTDAALAARERVRRAVEAVGPDLGGVLVDVCCFLKGLETVEAERRWPARSAKVVLRIALARLADHYAPRMRTTGPDRARLRHWGSADYRPVVDGLDRAVDAVAADRGAQPAGGGSPSASAGARGRDGVVAASGPAR